MANWKRPLLRVTKASDLPSGEGRGGWRANDYYKLFAKTFADAVVFFPEKILPEGSQTSKLLLARFTALGTIDQCSKYEDLMNAFGLVLWPGRQVP